MSSQSVAPTENSTFSIPSQFIFDEKDVYNKLSTIPTNKGIPNWVLKSYACILSSLWHKFLMLRFKNELYPPCVACVAGGVVEAEKLENTTCPKTKHFEFSDSWVTEHSDWLEY